MNDILEEIASKEDPIARQWSRALRNQPNSPYANMDEDALHASIRRSCQALLRVMQTGDTTQMEQTLRASARQRIAEGVSYSDNMAAWLLYRQALQEVLSDQLTSGDAWEQLVDRVDAVLDWIMTVLYDVYRKEQPGEPS